MRRVRDLRKYNLPETLLEIWEQAQGEFLLPVQEVAVYRYGLFDGKSQVISSPTSSGKTFVGEMAALKSAFEGKKILYLVPLRALAEEKYRTFRERYAAYGVKVVVATRDRREFDADIEQGNFHLAVLVYEKLSQLLVRYPHLLRTVALVVVDELQMLGDPERGSGLELTLTKLLASTPRPQLLGLSAVLREANLVAEWLEADLLFQDERPVELRRGVLFNGTFRYKTYNTGEEGEEELVDPGSDDPAEVLLSNVIHLVGKGEQVLIFLKAKQDAVRCALKLAETLPLSPSSKALEQLEPLEETVLKTQLKRCFASGVGFHHADLTQEERELVERHYRNGNIRVIACTTTLAFGVNLPASTVFLEAVKWDYDRRTGAALEVPISWAEHENISGRAGRLGFQDANKTSNSRRAAETFGRSALVAINQFQADLLWRCYIDCEGEEFAPVPGQEGLADRTLNLIASKMCTDRLELCHFLAHTYLSFLNKDELSALSPRVDKALEALARYQLILSLDDGKLEVSTLGEVAARKVIRAATAVRMASFLESAKEREAQDLEALHLLSLTEEGRRVNLPLSSVEHRSRVYESMIKETVGEAAETLGEDLARTINPRLMPTTQEAKSLKLALLLTDWIQGESLPGLEDKYRCYAGTIRGLSEEMSWLADATAAIAEVVGCSPALRQRLTDLADRLVFGVDTLSLSLARLRLPGIRRDEIKTMVRAGFDSKAAL